MSAGIYLDHYGYDATNFPEFPDREFSPHNLPRLGAGDIGRARLNQLNYTI